jgi:hypothetical protein
MSEGPHGKDDEPVGSVAEEAAKLLGVMGDWAKEHVQDVDEHLATDSAECRYCPICRTVHAMRTASPEVKAQLATAAQTFLQAAAGLLAAAAQPSQQPPSSVQHIDLDDDADDEPSGEGPP